VNGSFDYDAHNRTTREIEDSIYADIVSNVERALVVEMWASGIPEGREGYEEREVRKYLMERACAEEDARIESILRGLSPRTIAGE